MTASYIDIPVGVFLNESFNQFFKKISVLQKHMNKTSECCVYERVIIESFFHAKDGKLVRIVCQNAVPSFETFNSTNLFTHTASVICSEMKNGFCFRFFWN